MNGCSFYFASLHLALRFHQTKTTNWASLPTNQPTNHLPGYLYHKTGRECWLGPFGETPPPKWYIDHGPFNHNWPQRLKFIQNPNPPFDNRSLCAYLNQTSEEAGLAVYIDVIFSLEYNGVVQTYDVLHSSTNTATALDHQNRTLFVCYEELARSPEAMKEHVLEVLFSGGGGGGGGGGGDNRPQPWKKRQLLLQLQQQQPYVPVAASRHHHHHHQNKAYSNRQQLRRLGGYEGGHATSHDPELRQRLRQIIESLDHTLFGHLIATAQSKLNCGKSV